MDGVGDVLIEIHDEVPDVGIGREMLAVDVRLEIADDAVDVPEHAGHVAMDIENAVRTRGLWQFDFRKVHGAGRRALVHELGERHGDLATDRLLRLGRRAADMRRENDVR